MIQKTMSTLIAIFLLSGCAGVFKGTSQSVTFTSSPEGAEVIVDGISRGKTPLTLNLKKNQYESVIVKKDGYNSKTQVLTKSYDAIALLNVFWDLSTTDLLTGAAYEYRPNSYYFELSKKQESDQ